MAITFRANKGQALTYGEMDTNLGSYFYSSSIDNSGTVLVLHYTSSLNVPVNQQSHRVPLIKGIGNLGVDRRVAYFSGSNGLSTQEGFAIDLSGSVGIGAVEPIGIFPSKLYVNGVVTQASDERFKTNINTIDNALTKIVSSRGVTFEREGKTEIGVIAQEIQKTIPEVVCSDSNGYLSVSYSNIVGVLIEAIKEQDKKIANLEERLDNLLDK